MWISASLGGWAEMAIKVWSIGVLAFFSFIIGTNVEQNGNGEMTSAQWGALIALGAWSIAVYLVAIGYSEGKKK